MEAQAARRARTRDDPRRVGTISASLVLYKTPPELVEDLVPRLLRCRRLASLAIIDHSPRPCPRPFPEDPRVEFFSHPANPGFGGGHNFAIRRRMGLDDYHLVINPDIELGEDCLDRLAGYLDTSPETGMVMPRIDYPDGRIQNMGRLLPSPATLIFRRFLSWLPGFPRLTRGYELSAIPGDGPRNVPNLSGAFMLLRMAALRECGLFDERFFMYCEDIDLTRRLHASWRTEVLPSVKAVHLHARESYTNLPMTLIHVASAVKYFNKWGWLGDARAREINAATLRGLGIGPRAPGGDAEPGGH